MNPISLTARAYRTYSELALAFPEGVCAITGELANEPGKSNGSGKSSIANAIDLCLFGAQSRSLADEHNPAYGETMLLELVFEHAGETYRVRRTYTAKGTTVDLEEALSHNENTDGYIWQPLTRESTKATQAEIVSRLGFNRKVFRASAFLRQGDSAAFTNADPMDRRKILFDGLGLEVWAGLLKKARFSTKSCELRVADVSGMIDRAEPELAQRDGLALQLDQARENEQTAQASLAEATLRLSTAREALTEARGRVERRAGAEKAAQSAERALSELRAGIDQREGSVSGLDARLAERENLAVLAEGLRGLIDERDRLAEQAQGFAEWTRLNDLRLRLLGEANTLNESAHGLREAAKRTLEHVGSDSCRQCGQVLGAEAAEKSAAADRAEADRLDAQASERDLEAAATLLQMDALPGEAPDRERPAHVHDLIQQGQNAQSKLAALDEAQARRDEFYAEIVRMRAELPEREAAVATARAKLEALGPHDPNAQQDVELECRRFEAQEQSERGMVASFGKEIARLEERLARLDALAGEVHLATRERDQLRDELELLVALERAYGPNGIPAFIVENTAIPQVEAEACRILRDLGTEYQVELHTQRETKAGGVADALDIVVYDGIRARPYEGFSGGEKTRIELALRIALAHLLANRRGAESRVLVVDEPDGLDSAGMAALADVLRRLYADSVFEKILLVSHVAELRDAFESSIHVVCENGVSRVDGTREMVTA